MATNNVELLNILNTGYNVCLVLAIVFLLLSIVLFFVLDIRRVYMIKSGKAAKRDIRKLQETNFQTGQLSQFSRMDMGQYTNTGTLEPSEDLYPTAPMTPQAAPVPPSVNETTVLHTDETTVLNNGSAPARSYHFNIVKNEMHIHTTEFI